MSVLVFDFGLKHIGVAVAERNENFAFALTTLSTQEGRPGSPVMQALFAEWQPEQVVVGLPLNMDGTVTELNGAVKRFATQLEVTYGVPAVLVDERLSTFEARQRVADKVPDHQVAAQVIAETWLQQTLEA